MSDNYILCQSYIPLYNRVYCPSVEKIYLERKHLSLVLEDKIYPQKRKLLRPGTVNVIYFCTKSYSIKFKIPKKIKKRPFITICIVVSVTVRDCQAYGIYLIFKKKKQTIQTYFGDNFF